MARVLKESRGDVVVTLDCDGTYPAAEIPNIADMVLKGECDLVNASRLQTRPSSMPWPNYFANWLFAVTGRILLGVKSTDLHSGMRAYSREIIERVEVDPERPSLAGGVAIETRLGRFSHPRDLHPLRRAHRRHHAAPL